MIHHGDDIGLILAGRHLLAPARLVGAEAKAAVKGCGAAFDLHEAPHGALAPHDLLRRVLDEEVEAAGVVRRPRAGVDVEPPKMSSRRVLSEIDLLYILYNSQNK